MAKLTKRKTTKVQITMPAEILEKIDEEVSKNFITKSTWFLNLAIEALNKAHEKDLPMKKIIDLDI